MPQMKPAAPRTEASAFLKAGASPGSGYVHHVQEEWVDARSCDIDEHMLSIREHAHRNINKGSVSSSGYLFKKRLPSERLWKRSSWQ